ncbi:MAG: TIGR03960 family B12-binding radical SAM protein [Planctomycetes bacterium]|nr:TIGR03960 family B12-binding radical SAM protein [Planctomycetota bacterium]
MLNGSLRERIVARLLPRVQTPGQYIGGEWNSVVKDHQRMRGRLCLAFPDTYAIGMSHHGLQVLYSLMNRREDWACERAFCPWPDMEALLREHGLPLFSLESYTPLDQFDVLGFTLQYELGCTNVLTMLDLAGIPLGAEERTADHPLVIAGGPCVQNPEPMARFIDLFVVGDGEESLPAVCDAWLEAKAAGGDRTAMLARLATRLPYVYVPRFYRPETAPHRHAVCVRPTRADVPATIEPAVADLASVPLPTAPIVPWIECIQDRISVEIMRGCPGRCRFCQSTTLKRPLRFRSVDTIVAAALESYRNTGFNEVSLLSLSTSDYPQFDELMRRMQETFRPLGVSISVPSLRVNEQLRAVGEWLNTDRRSGLTLAPEVARDSLRRVVGKRISNDDLYEGCRHAFSQGFQRVKLYFMCGLPGETEDDLDGIIEMAETISRLGKEVIGRPPKVVASVSNFVPKPQTAFQWNGMQTREYLLAAHRHLWERRRVRSIDVKCHDVETSLLEGVIARGDRNTAQVIELAWRRGARFDAWSEHIDHQRWWQALEETGIDVDDLLHNPWPPDARLPWDHIGIQQGRGYLEREQQRCLEVEDS